MTCRQEILSTALRLEASRTWKHVLHKAHIILCVMLLARGYLYSVSKPEENQRPFTSQHSTRGTIDISRAPTEGTDRALVLTVINNDFQNQRRHHE